MISACITHVLSILVSQQFKFYYWLLYTNIDYGITASLRQRKLGTYLKLKLFCVCILIYEISSARLISKVHKWDKVKDWKRLLRPTGLFIVVIAGAACTVFISFSSKWRMNYICILPLSQIAHLLAYVPCQCTKNIT